MSTDIALERIVNIVVKNSHVTVSGFAMLQEHTLEHGLSVHRRHRHRRVCLDVGRQAVKSERQFGKGSRERALLIHLLGIDVSRLSKQSRNEMQIFIDLGLSWKERSQSVSQTRTKRSCGSSGKRQATNVPNRASAGTQVLARTLPALAQSHGFQLIDQRIRRQQATSSSSSWCRPTHCMLVGLPASIQGPFCCT